MGLCTEGFVTAAKSIDKSREAERLSAALRLVIQRYQAQLRRMPVMAAAALLLPAIGEVLASYGPPLLIAKLLGGFARKQQFTAAALAPYVLAFALMWLTGQALWRIAMVRLRYDPATAAYRDRRAKEQKTNKDIMRCLKRYIAREVYRALLADSALRGT